MTTVKIRWVAEFPTQEEADLLIESVARIHAEKYGTEAALLQIQETGHYSGARNFITVEKHDE